MCRQDSQGYGSRRDNLVEGAAISASLLCLVHCLALPLLLLLLPGVVGLFASSDAFHYVVLALVVPSALAAFWFGYRRHRTRFPATLGIVGTACLIVALLLPTSENAETWLTVAGSLLLVVGHLINWRLRSHAV